MLDLVSCWIFIESKAKHWIILFKDIPWDDDRFGGHYSMSYWEFPLLWTKEELVWKVQWPNLNSTRVVVIAPWRWSYKSFCCMHMFYSSRSVGQRYVEWLVTKQIPQTLANCMLAVAIWCTKDVRFEIYLSRDEMLESLNLWADVWICAPYIWEFYVIFDLRVFVASIVKFVRVPLLAVSIMFLSICIIPS